MIRTILNRYLIALTLVAGLLAGGCRGTAGTPPAAGDGPEREAAASGADVSTAGVSITDPSAADPSASRTAELEALFHARADSARMRFTEADVRFMTMMIAHHAQALIMARLAETHDAGAEVRRLAARIHNAQQDEIATMQQWLRARGQPVPEVHIDGLRLAIRTAAPEHGAPGGQGDAAHDHAAHGAHADAGHAGPGHAAHDHAGMPGMLTDEQLGELDAARGREFDRLFLTYMIEHHRGAVVMVHDLFATDGAGQDEEVFKFAADVQVDQVTEIARMELMLAALRGEGRRP